MQITAVKTRPLLPPQDDLLPVLADTLRSVTEHSIIAISSKVVAINEGRTVSIPEGTNVRELKDSLAKKEAEYYIERNDSVTDRLHTIRGGVLISSCGIDQSNGDGYLVLWPEDPMASARTLLTAVRETCGFKEVGVIVTDSHGTPLRNGATGFALGYAGFHALHDYRHTADIFGRELRAERLNIADSLAAAANVVMGEGNECTPLAIIKEIPRVVFSDNEPDDPYLSLKVSRKEDVFRTFIDAAPWIEAKGEVQKDD